MIKHVEQDRRLPSRADDSNTTILRELTGSYIQFGFDLLRELSSKAGDKNIFISPTSIAVALAMTANGANGETRDALLRTLHCEKQFVETFNAVNRLLVTQLRDTTAVQLSMANALWLQQGLVGVKTSFYQLLQQFYCAEAETLDFRNPAAAQAINDWVAKQTDGRIHHILDRVDPAAVAVLANAIAFQGKWALPFDAKVTRPGDFKTATGTVRQMPMMRHSARYFYANSDGREAIRVPYANGTFAMYIAMPQNGNGIRSFVRNLTGDEFKTLRASLTMHPGTIELPRFTMTYQVQLNAGLKALGMGIAFDPKAADFTRIHDSPPPLWIDEVRHACFLRVDEEGTEAVAATVVTHRALALAPAQEFHMVVDHPFFLAIRDERNGQILFAGVINDPQNCA